MNAASLLVALVAARKEAGLSQRQLAARLGRVHSYVAKIERGQRRLSVPEFLEVATALAVDPRELLTRIIGAAPKVTDGHEEGGAS